jgi:hypothetical protein
MLPLLSMSKTGYPELDWASFARSELRNFIGRTREGSGMSCHRALAANDILTHRAGLHILGMDNFVREAS